MDYVIPIESTVKNTLAMLFGDGFEVGSASAPDANGSYAGIFINPEGQPVAACLADRGGAAYMSAALSMVPPHTAKQAAEDGDMSEMMVGNLYEVMNILTCLVMSDSTPHLKLEKVEKADGDGAVANLLQSGTRIDFSVSIPKYGDGIISFVVT